jgi:hypothetical protein
LHFALDEEMAMKRPTADTVFKPTLSRTESKNDTTTRVARGIVDTEAAAMIAKTERLRAARLAREATDVKPASPARRRKAVRSEPET